MCISGCNCVWNDMGMMTSPPGHGAFPSTDVMSDRTQVLWNLLVCCQHGFIIRAPNVCTLLCYGRHIHKERKSTPWVNSKGFECPKSIIQLASARMDVIYRVYFIAILPL